MCAHVDNDTSNKDKILALFKSSNQVVERQEFLSVTMGNDECKERLVAVKHEPKDGHFKGEWKSAIIAVAISKADKNKKTDNKKQAATGVTMTLTTLGLIAHSDLCVKDHTADLINELASRDHRDINYSVDHSNPKKRNKQKTFTDLRNELKRLEMHRVGSMLTADDGHKGLAKRGFEKQSAVPFHVNKECVALAMFVALLFVSNLLFFFS